MHTDLSPHLHSTKCNELIALLNKCHTDNQVLKFFGVCNSIDSSVIKCLKEERLAKRQRNYEMSLANKKKHVVKEKTQPDTN